MRIATNQCIAGYPAMKVRNFLRRYRDTGDCPETAETRLGLGQEDADEFIEKLVGLGPIDLSRSWDENQQFTLTPKGETLANASAAKSIHRKTAEHVLAAFMERVNAVNARFRTSLSSQ